MPKLAVILPPSLPIPPVRGGSIQTVAYDQLKELKGFDIYTFSKKEKGSPDMQKDGFGITHYYISDSWYDKLEIPLGDDFLFRYNKYIYKVLNLLKKIGPDIVHVHNRPHFVPIIRKVLGSKVKIVLSEHNTKISESKFIQKQLKNIMSSVDKITFCSEFLKNKDLLADHPEYADKAKVIYNSIDLELFRSKEVFNKEDIKLKYKVKDKRVVLFVGRLVKEKGADALLEAFKKVAVEEKDTVLVIVGSAFFQGAKKTSYVKALENVVKELKDRVVFTGFIQQKDMPEIYAMADVFVAPVKWEEPLSKVNHEAGAVGVPVITVKTGGIPEVVRNGETGILLPAAFSENELYSAIKGLLNNEQLREKLSTNAQKWIKERFSAKEIAKEWAEFYKKLI